MGYDLSVSRARDPLIVITIFVVVALVTVVLRLQARRLRKTPFGLDDGFMLAATTLLLVSVGLYFACVIVSGVGRHREQLHPPYRENQVKLLKMLLTFSLLYSFEESFIKISIICFYLRIFGDSKSFRIQAYVLIAILSLWTLAGLLETALLCKPFASNWNLFIPNGHCGNRKLSYKVTGAVNVVTDFLTMALPISQIIHLNLPVKKKLGLVFMFSLGTFITVISILRIESLHAINPKDFAYTITMSFLWTTLEPCLCIINTNLPMTRTFLAIIAPSIFGSSLHNATTELSTTVRGDKEGQFQVIDFDERYGYLRKKGIDVEMNRLGNENRISGGREKLKASSSLSCI